MAEISGYGGSITFSDALLYISDATRNIHAWNLDLNADALEVTSFADAGDRSYIRGLKGWTAGCESYVDGTLAIQASDIGYTAKLILYTSDALYYYGDAVLTGVSASVSVDAVATQSLKFQGTDALVYSDAS